ncbi:MAG: DUF4199 domain-containing protein [Prevotella sp.]|nr:DUF4199 domain-containing protein [Prevotella sp.]MBR1462931.1 DUF4199 domain-containing protein [Prevotella sp.]
MATPQEYEQVKAFARIDGALVALMWTGSFACFVGNFYNPMFGMLFFIIGAMSLVFAAMRLKRFRDHILDGIISFRRAFTYSILTYLYASLLFAMVQYLYFQFLDHGYLMGQYLNVASSPEFNEMMKVYGLNPGELKLAMENIASLRPIEIALQFFTTDIMMGFFISLPVAMIMTKKNVRKRA